MSISSSISVDEFRPSDAGNRGQGAEGTKGWTGSAMAAPRRPLAASDGQLIPPEAGRRRSVLMQALVKGAAIGCILGGLLLAGCGRAATPNSNAGAGSIATSSSTATTSPMAALSCSLPVAQAIYGPTAPTTGFVALPSGTFQADATGAMVTEPGT